MNNIPEFNVMDYKVSMIRMLNFFNTDVPGKDKQAWVINYWSDQNKVTKGLEKLSDGYFNQCAVLVKLKEDGYDLEPEHQAFLDNHYQFLIKKTKQPVYDDDGNEVLSEEEAAKKAEASKKVVNIQERMEKVIREHIAEFDNAIDELCTVGTDFDAKVYLKGNQVKSVAAKRIADHLKGRLKEWDEISKSKDPQVREGYSNYDKRGFKTIMAFIQNAMDECNTMAVVARTTMAPRKRKEKPASVVAAKVKYMKEHAELGMKSLKADKIVGSSMVVLFDTKYRKLIQYECLEGSTLTVRGTTLLNFDPEKSYSKTIRKPELLKGIQAMTKRPYAALMKSFNANEIKVTGRINEAQVILLAF